MIGNRQNTYNHKIYTAGHFYRTHKHCRHVRQAHCRTRLSDHQMTPVEVLPHTGRNRGIEAGNIPLVDLVPTRGSSSDP